MWKIHFKKSNIFLREAEIDIENNCYLKAISASYFAIEHMLRALLIKKFGSTPSKIGSIFSLIDKLFLREIGEETKIEHYRKLMIKAREIYNHRKDIDHLSKIPEEREAKEILKETKLIIDELRKLFKFFL